MWAIFFKHFRNQTWKGLIKKVLIILVVLFDSGLMFKFSIKAKKMSENECTTENLQRKTQKTKRINGVRTNKNRGFKDRTHLIT